MLGMVSLFTDAASEMIYPLVPVFVTMLGSGAIVLGIIEGVAETTAALLKLISGIISDKIGKRKLLVLIGYTISSLIRPLTGTCLLGLADSCGPHVRQGRQGDKNCTEGRSCCFISR